MNQLRVKELLREKNLTQKWLAEKMNVAEISLSRSINGNPSLDTLEKIAAALDVPISELFEYPEQSLVRCPNCGYKLRLSKEE